MNHIAKYSLVLLLLCLNIMGVEAQELNTLSIADVTGSMGGKVSLPVNLDNTCHDIVAVQFRLTVPKGITVDSNSAKFGVRTDNHSAVIQKNGNSYTVVVYCAENKTISGNSGQLMTIDLTIGTGFTPGGDYDIELSEVLLGNKQGKNVATGFSSGKLHIAEVPDFVVTDVQPEGTSFDPGDNITVSWKVKNQGGLASTGGWSEQVSLIGSDGHRQLLGTVYHETALNAGETVSRLSTFQIPQLLGIEGKAQIQVKLTPNNDAGELAGQQSNNTVVGQQTITLSKQLILTVPQVVPEGNRTLSCRLARSGSWNTAQTFGISIEGDSRISSVTTVTIGKGQSTVLFSITLRDDDLLNTSDQFTVKASGEGYEMLSAQITIEDNEYPSLSLKSSKEEVAEGESFQLTVAIPKPVANPLEVKLFCERPSHFKFPSTITILEGETSAIVDVEILDDTEVNNTLDIAFRVEAAKYNDAETIVLLIDNDMPDIELILTPSIINESSGAGAVIGKVRKLNHLDSKITVKLKDDSNGRLYYSSSTLVLEKGIEQREFTIGIVDNSIVDGNFLAAITASIYISSCNCSAEGTSGGKVTKTITILDDDGPSLMIGTRSTCMLEGSTDNILTITRNTSTEKALIVTLNSTDDDVLVYNHTITIPAGQKSTDVNIKVLSNDSQDDSKTISFTAQADGYTSGTCWVMINDQSLPDLVISDVTLDKEFYQIGDEMILSVSVTNSGNAVFVAPSNMLLYINGNSSLLQPLYINENLQPNQTVTIQKQIQVPRILGKLSLQAEINHNQSPKELIYVNNKSKMQTLQVLSPFTVSLKPEVNQYIKGETVVLKGQASGKDAVNTSVEIYIIQGKLRQTIITQTDENGLFSAEWKPYSAQIGHFGVGACFPGEGKTTAQAYVDIIGLQCSTPNYITCETAVGEEYMGSIKIENPCSITQHITSVEILEQPADCVINLSKPKSISARDEGLIRYSLKGNAPTAGNDWEKLNLRITTAEGAQLDLSLYYFCRSPKGMIEASINSIKTTMVKGMERDYAFTIFNRGRGDTGPISLSLPDVDWLKAVTPLAMGSLAANEEAEIVLRLSPDIDMPLNSIVKGHFCLICENANTLSIPYYVENVSENKGQLIVDVTDEYTYYPVSGDNAGSITSSLVEGPHVSGATVVLSHPVTKTVIMTGKTEEDGTFRTQLPEGQYLLTVSSSNHESYSGMVVVNPGIDNIEDVFISFSAITYSWEVIETEVEDEYRIVTTAVYETNVPKPVIVLTMPKEEPQVNSVIPIIATNKGLITGLEPQLKLSCSEGYELKLLNDESVVSIAPQQSYIYYVLFTEADSGNRTRGSASGDQVESGTENTNPCKGITASIFLHYICGTEDRFFSDYAAGKWGKCLRNGTIGPAPGGSGGGGGYVGGGGGITAPYTVGNRPGSGGVAQFMSPITPPPSYHMSCANNLKELFEPLRDCLTGLGSGCLGEYLKNISGWNKMWDDFLGKENKYKSDYAKGQVDDLLDDLIDIIKDYTNNNDIDLPVGSACAGALGTCVAAFQAAYQNMSSMARADSRGYDSSGIVSAAEEMYRYYSLLLDWLNAKESIYLELFGDKCWMECNNSTLVAFLSALHLYRENDGHIKLTDDLMALRPENITIGQVQAFVNRLNASADSMVQNGATDSAIDMQKISSSSETLKDEELKCIQYGFMDMEEMYDYSYSVTRYLLQDNSQSVCTSITLQIPQTMTMTRQAFRGTLSVYNGHETTPMQNVQLHLEVRDEEGNLASAHEFQINAESIDGFKGELSLTSGWSLEAGQTGKATILFIPTIYAAPMKERNYTFGGSLIYRDPFTGKDVARSLSPVELTVKPSPSLELTYFMQRDIMGDDPLTPNVIEPKIPAEFSLVIKNNGYGDATNVKMFTDQPRIIENEKGLAISFEILSSILNGKKKTLAMGQLVATDFGTIAAKSTAYAQWMLESSLLGHFTSYRIDATHITSYGNEDLSLLDTVTIHELIHGFSIQRNDIDGRAFLVNDIADAYDRPDRVFFSDGTQQPVTIVDAVEMAEIKGNEYLLTIRASSTGWNYGSIKDPTSGRRKLVSVTRLSDGQIIPAEAFWQTNRTLIDGREWLYESRLHFADSIKLGQEQYRIVFTDVPKVLLNVKKMEGVPILNEIVTTPVETIIVTFNKAIDPSSFTYEDFKLYYEGQSIDVSGVSVTQMSNQQFKLDLSSLTRGSGYYVLVLQTAEITDTEGFNGSTGKSIDWIEYTEGKVSLSVKCRPVDGGTVTPTSGYYEYDTDVMVGCSAADGYYFSRWVSGNETLSTDEAFTYHLSSDAELTAVFAPKHYIVSISYDTSLGNVQNASSGIYNYGTQLVLVAEPEKECMFKHWTINGEVVEDSKETLTITVTDAIEISAVFVRDIYYQTITLSQGWNWVSSYLKEPLSVEPFSSIANRIVGQTDELISDPLFGLIGNLDAMYGGSSYKIKADQPYSHTFMGHLYDPEVSPIRLHNGWNWISYPYFEELDIDETVKNAEEGDYLVSQTGFAEYANGNWDGSLGMFVPGMGYLYKSASDKNLQWNIPAVARSRGGRVRIDSGTSGMVDIFRYPNTMNVTAQIVLDGMRQSADAYNLYAFVGDELRGASLHNGMNCYLTIYGDEPVAVSFILESTVTGETFLADETLKFRNDVVGSRKSPFVLNFSSATGINGLGFGRQPMTIYNLQGILVSREATLNTLRRLPKGVYIVNGHKFLVK